MSIFAAGILMAYLVNHSKNSLFGVRDIVFDLILTFWADHATFKSSLQQNDCLLLDCANSIQITDEATGLTVPKRRIKRASFQ